MAERPYRYLDDVYGQPASLIRSLQGLQAQTPIVLGFAIVWPRSALPVEDLIAAWRQVDAMIPEWHDVIEHDGDFFAPGSTLYLLARSMDLANAWEGRLLMEECGKSGATVMPTGAFRHGPQEVISPQFRGILWLPSTRPVHGYDCALAESIAGLGGRCMLIGRELPASANSHLKFELPPAPEFAAALFGVLPVQLGAYLLALRKGKNPDELVYCPYIVTTEGAL